MRSHTTSFAGRDLAATVGLPIGVLLLLAGMLHLAAALRCLPAPRPTLDMDRTLLVHQADASRMPQDASVILVGDSSCLMDVSAPDLTQALGQPVLNLGLLSYLDLSSFGRLVRNLAQTSPGQLRAVVLLLHPESLRLQASSAYHRQQLEDYLAGRDARSPGRFGARLQEVLGADLVRGRILARAIPAPLPGEYGRLYGFTHDFARSLSANRGSATDPGRFERSKAEGNAEYRLAKRFEVESRQFRACVPPGVRLMVGLTPAPGSFVGPDHGVTCQQLLEKWAGWLKADVALTGLPATMPDDRFASVTHLTREGSKEFTGLLAAELRARLGRPP